MEDNVTCDVLVLAHGIDSPFGTDDMRYLKESFIEHSRFCNSIIINSNRNTGKTTDGIETGGKRLAEEILEELLKYEEKIAAKSVTYHLTLIGHSLGGLYCRNCIKFLYQSEVWSRIVPVSLITMSSPHLGVRRPFTVWNWVVDSAARIYYRGQTLKELLLEDGDPTHSDSTKHPLLYRMTVPGTPYMEALSKFRHRTLFSIVKDDFQVPYCSASLCMENSYDRTRKSEFSASSILASIRGHYGFSQDDYAHILEKEMEKVFRTKNDKESIEDVNKGLVFVNDNYNELCYLPAMLWNLNTLHWRRVDFEFQSTFCHDFFIVKPTIPWVVNAEHGRFAVEKLIAIVVSDHLVK